MSNAYYAAAGAAGARDMGVHIAIGELVTYDPSTHSGDFRLPMYIDNLSNPTDSGDPITTGMIPIGTLMTGPGYGLRMVPYVDPDGGSQAIIVFSDQTLEHPLCAVLLYNDNETPPFTDAHTSGWQDSQGNQVITDDSQGLVELVGVDEGAIVAPEVGLGDLFSNLGSDNDVVTVAMLRSAVTTVFNSHVHSGVQTGSGSTAVPTTTMTPEGSTTVRAKN